MVPGIVLSRSVLIVSTHWQRCPSQKNSYLSVLLLAPTGWGLATYVLRLWLLVPMLFMPCALFSFPPRITYFSPNFDIPFQTLVPPFFAIARPNMYALFSEVPPFWSVLSMFSKMVD